MLSHKKQKRNSQLSKIQIYSSKAIDTQLLTFVISGHDIIPYHLSKFNTQRPAPLILDGGNNLRLRTEFLIGNLFCFNPQSFQKLLPLVYCLGSLLPLVLQLLFRNQPVTRTLICRYKDFILLQKIQNNVVRNEFID